MKKLIVEFIGTFFLVFTIATAALMGGAGDMAPLAIGAVLMVMVYAGGHISGAAYNPAVTLALMLRGTLSTQEFIRYVIVQLLAAIFAALFVAKIINQGAVIASFGTVHTGPAAAAEFLFTFALCWVVLNVATAKATKGNSYYGLAIGFTVAGGAFAIGGLSGGVFNPAVGAALLVFEHFEMKTILIYTVTQFVAAAAAAIVFQQVTSE